MRFDQLQHAIRAACDVSGDTELIIFGSQAILGSYPHAPKSLRTSIEVDVQALNHPEMTGLIDGSLGEGSLFHLTHGFYVHGLSIDSATLPEGWFARTVEVCDQRDTRGNKGLCLEAHDLAASKLAAFREKDRIFVATLMVENMVDRNTLYERILLLPIAEDHRDRLLHWVSRIAQELEDDKSFRS